MELTHDYTQSTPHGGYCRIRIYTDTTELPVILCTELDDNPGQSITNAAERIAAEVLANHPDIFDPLARSSIPGADKPLIWIEHYQTGARGTKADPSSFDLVEFSSYQIEDLGPYRAKSGSA